MFVRRTSEGKPPRSVNKHLCVHSYAPTPTTTQRTIVESLESKEGFGYRFTDAAATKMTIMESLKFKKGLYLIGERLTDDEVTRMKFVCQAEKIQRRQAEMIKSAFELFCALAEKNHISPENTEFLASLLEGVHKEHLMKELPAEEHHLPDEPRTPTVEYSGAVETRCRRFLDDLGEELPERDFRNLAIFFSGKDISLQEIEAWRQPSELFQRLRDCGIISPLDLQQVRFVLDTIGRADLCERIDGYTRDRTADPAETHRSTETQRSGRQTKAATIAETLMLTFVCIECMVLTRRALSWAKRKKSRLQEKNPKAVAVLKRIRDALEQQIRGKSKAKHTGSFSEIQCMADYKTL